jgi:hypothetical protein
MLPTSEVERDDASDACVGSLPLAAAARGRSSARIHGHWDQRPLRLRSAIAQ